MLFKLYSCSSVTSVRMGEAPESGQFIGSEADFNSELPNDEEWDTDLEDSCPEKISNISQEQIYLAACKKLGVPPASNFIKQMGSSKVDLRHYGLLDQGLLAVCHALNRNITVTTLNLHDNGITKTGAQGLASLLEENCFLTDLDISGNDIGVEGSQAMERMLKNTSSLRQLHVSNICRNGGHILPLLEGLKENYYLKVLDLSHNCLNDEGAATLGSILCETSSLEFLNVRWNNITAQGAADLINGLRDCYTLKELDFSWNSLSGVGAQALRVALEANESLLHLDVTNTSIRLPEAKIIAKGLKRNKTLQVLYIGNNPYLSKGVHALLKAIRRNHESALEELHLQGMALDRDCHKELEDVIQKRPNFNCTWQISIQGGQARDLMSPEKASPLDVFVRFARNSGLRMMDMFKELSGKRDTIVEEDFIAGLKKMNISMTKADLKTVFSILDVNRDGKLQFHEFPNLVTLKLHEQTLERTKLHI